ncbi:MAG: transporter substrate-binding domain-containing protein [Anaerocolumna aminovalerica]|jgi:polar amino acid transport system substrate-binding protein|uniref:cysteine ABC transporter substrate-binding protein n=1 Tax=Anaerocolumna aminovalerica TaxID=1527 RepID=UPI002646FBCE|nr:transporter substrate-binding domain-containing protein [Anaerocolumna aminovalerica]MDU6265295.1 transporter substrate-binding domain-containing protein [Anaerocolumna aminovalerica]
MKKMKKRYLIILAVMTLVIGLTGCGKKDSTVSGEGTKGKIEKIKEAGVVKIGVFGDKPPFGYVAEDGSNVGYDVYLGRQIAKDLLGDESKVEFVLLEAANRIEYLKSKKVDIVLANFTVTEERKEQVNFAEPYMKVALGVVAPEDSPIASVEDLKGKTLIVNRGTTAELYFTENYPDIKLVAYDENTETFQALVDGRGDALSHDNTLLFAWTFENKGYKIVDGNIGSQDTIAPAVNKDDTDLLEWLNNEIKTLTANGFFKEAYDAELKDHFSPDTNPDDVIFEK